MAESVSSNLPPREATRFGCYAQFDAEISKTNTGFDKRRYAAKWETLHMASLTYPVKPTDSDKAKWTRYMEAFIDPGIGCEDCVAHAAEMFAQEPIDYGSRSAFVWSLFQFHNRVRRRLRQPEMSAELFMETYVRSSPPTMRRLLNKDASLKENDRNWWVFALLASCSIIVAAVYLRRNNHPTPSGVPDDSERVP